MIVNGTLINYFYHCKKQCYLHGNRINLENNSEDVKIGKALHNIKSTNEIKLENIAIDKITSKYVVEYKKSDADPIATKMQVLYYLKKLKEKGIYRQGKIIYLENNKSEQEIILDEESEKEIDKCILEIKTLIALTKPPEAIIDKKCRKCAYYNYCNI